MAAVPVLECSLMTGPVEADRDGEIAQVPKSLMLAFIACIMQGVNKSLLFDK